MKKNLPFATEVQIIVDEHRLAVQDGPHHSMGTAEACVEELLELGYRELARL